MRLSLHIRRTTLRASISFLVLCSLITPLLPTEVLGLSFNPEQIISDEDFFHADDMTRDDVQHFLERKGSGLASYMTADSSGVQKRASDIIWDAAEKNGINPKVLLVLLQKEQSLIENPSPSQSNLDWATGFARCDTCSSTDVTVAAYRGFATQVEKAASRKKYYTTNPGEFTYRRGVSSLVDGMTITPANLATAALYNYTPHISGNFSFWKLWMRYFSKIFPDGLVVQEDGKQDIWLIQNGQKRKFTSMSVFLSRYQFKNIATVGANDLDKYNEGTPIRFAQYSLLRVSSGGVYLIVDDGKYGIPSKKVFRSIGFNPDEVIDVSDADIANVPTIGFLSAPDQSPIGELLQDKKTGGVFYVALGKKHPIHERGILQANFSYMTIKPVASKVLDTYDLADPILFADGTLVKTPLSSTVYIISHGTKRPIATQEAFEALGLQWSRAITSTGDTLSLHPDGPPVDIGQPVDEYISPTLVSVNSK